MREADATVRIYVDGQLVRTDELYEDDPIELAKRLGETHAELTVAALESETPWMVEITFPDGQMPLRWGTDPTMMNRPEIVDLDHLHERLNEMIEKGET